MLVLSRKEAQRIRLGDSIVVTIVKISGDKVRVGIEAPSDVLVLRDELEPRESQHVAHENGDPSGTTDALVATNSGPALRQTA